MFLGKRRESVGNSLFYLGEQGCVGRVRDAASHLADCTTDMLAYTLDLISSERRPK